MTLSAVPLPLVVALLVSFSEAVLSFLLKKGILMMKMMATLI